MDFGLNVIDEAGMTVAYFQTLAHPAQAPLRETYEATGATLLPIARYFKALTGEPPTGQHRPASSTIRSYAPEDGAEVVRLSLRSWEPVFASLKKVLGDEIFSRLHPDWRLDQQVAVETVCADAGTEVRVAEVGGAVVGFVATTLDTATHIGEVEMLAVDPAYQRHGIGLALTELALASMESAGMRAAVIETGGDPGHGPARRTYEAAGCTPVSIARFFKALGSPPPGDDRQREDCPAGAR
jgi:ribosomal protein S18 acetylase RimI-like enzyme